MNRKIRIYSSMFEKLEGVEHITKVVTLIVKREEYDCLGIMIIRSFKQNYYEGVQNSINNSERGDCGKKQKIYESRSVSGNYQANDSPAGPGPGGLVCPSKPRVF